MKNLANIRSRKLDAKGFTLIEILVALLIISIGLLGVAALHSSSIRNNYDALLRSHASALASDIADRMRANAAAIDDYAVAVGTAVPLPPSGSPQHALDLYEWKQSLAAQLPAGDGSVVINAVTNVVTITVQWGERGDNIQFITETEI